MHDPIKVTLDPSKKHNHLTSLWQVEGMTEGHKDCETQGRHQVWKELPDKGENKHDSLGALLFFNLLSADLQDFIFEVEIPSVELDGLDVLERFRGDVHTFFLQFLLFVTHVLYSTVKITIKLVAEDHEREAYTEDPTHGHEQSKAAIHNPHWSQDKVGRLVAEPDNALTSSYNRVNLTWFIVFTGGRSEFEHLSVDQRFQTLGRLGACIDVVVPAMNVEHMHEDVQEDH